MLKNSQTHDTTPTDSNELNEKQPISSRHIKSKIK
jgi:hypothetical protein